MRAAAGRCGAGHEGSSNDEHSTTLDGAQAASGRTDRQANMGQPACACPPLRGKRAPATHPATCSSASCCWLPSCLMEDERAALPCFIALPALRSRLPMRPLLVAPPTATIPTPGMPSRTPSRVARSATCRLRDRTQRFQAGSQVLHLSRAFSVSIVSCAHDAGIAPTHPPTFCSKGSLLTKPSEASLRRSVMNTSSICRVAAGAQTEVRKKSYGPPGETCPAQLPS